MINDWSNINYSAITINNNQREITKLYGIMENWLTLLTNDDREVMNDIFMKVINALPNFNQKKGKVHNYICTIAINHIRTIKRKKKNVIEIIRFPENLVIIDETVTNVEDALLYNEKIDSKIKYLEQVYSQEELVSLFEYYASDKKKTGTQKNKIYQLKKRLKNAEKK